jgi:hypothetical protein
MESEIFNPGAASFFGSILIFGVPVLLAVVLQYVAKPFFPTAKWITIGPWKLAERVGIVMVFVYLGAISLFFFGGAILGLGLAAWDFVKWLVQ